MSQSATGGKVRVLSGVHLGEQGPLIILTKPWSLSEAFTLSHQYTFCPPPLNIISKRKPDCENVCVSCTHEQYMCADPTQMTLYRTNNNFLYPLESPTDKGIYSQLLSSYETMMCVIVLYYNSYRIQE